MIVIFRVCLSTKALNSFFWGGRWRDQVWGRDREGGPKIVSKLFTREWREPGAVKPVTRREQLGPGRASNHTYSPRPPSCPQSHTELKQQWEQLRFRRQESPWQRDSSCRQTPLQFTRSFSSLKKLPTQEEQNGHGWHLLLMLSCG